MRAPVKSTAWGTLPAMSPAELPDQPGAREPAAASEHAATRQPAALVTGSARRLGRHLAERLIGLGWLVVIHATEDARAEAAAAELGAAGHVGGDLRDLAACDALVDAAVAQLGGELDLLVNNAGSFVLATPQQTTPQDWAEAFDVNARAPLFLAMRAAPTLAARRGLIVNISDHAAHEHWGTRAVHSASKAALESLTLSCAKALAPDVRVNGICPGPVLPPDDADAELLAQLERRGGIGTPEQVSDVLLQLIASPARTGEIVVL